MNDQILLNLMSRPTRETHCPACLELWYALGVVIEPCEHDRTQDDEMARIIDGGMTDPPAVRQR